MGLKSLLNSRWFDPSYKFKVHLLQFVLIAIIVALAIGKIITRPDHIPMNRMDIVAITMSVKTIVILSYQLLAEHVARFARWKSLRAYAILNTLEVVFWIGVVVMSFMGVTMICVGVSCALGVFVALVAMVMVAVCLWMAVVSWADFRHQKNFGTLRGEPLAGRNPYTMDDASFSSRSAMK